MYDADTLRLFAEAPPLSGVDPKEVPQQLTNAYASIVAHRIRLRGMAQREQVGAELLDAIDQMTRLAFTYEAMVSSVPSRPNRNAAAFVAASAHQVALLADRLLIPEGRSSRLSIDAIAPEVAATLLFLIAEASTDAAEAAKAIVLSQENGVETVLLKAIVLLAKGRLEEIESLVAPMPSEIEFPTSLDAHNGLLLMLMEGVRALAREILSNSPQLERSENVEQFELVKILCVEQSDAPLSNGKTEIVSSFPGAFHLASLLSSVAQDLAFAAVSKLPPPAGLDGHQWALVMRDIAKRRPYLWRNHRQAVAEQYLETGVSAAISFPTGAGKSTLAELKIAATLIRGKKVIFLAPTLALVDQTAKALSAVFRSVQIQRERWDALTFENLLIASLPEVTVMTPERCLAMTAVDPSAFDGVGLLVFDECHLLHPREIRQDRRSIDAMLCVLNFVSAVPDADLLFLSAMMKNGGEIAGWISSVLGRKCLALDLTWKPTRQVRGCVVYEASKIRRLSERMNTVRSEVTSKGPPATLQREMNVQPYGFFCLHQTWQSQARKDYSLVPLLDSQIRLGIGTTAMRRWYLTPNGNEVAADLAAASAGLGLKTLIFVQTIPFCESISRSFPSAPTPTKVQLGEEEQKAYRSASEELGGALHLYAQVSAAGLLESTCLPHHGLLLPVERQLHESLYRRVDGLNVLVATSTLAQGMNLPSEVVIIAGDSRFEPSANRLEQLEAHELLNAAGRAGRAGEGAHGFVLVVPSKVVDFDSDKNTIARHWIQLKAIFAQSDQCLEIEDPIAPLLDEIQAANDQLSEGARYLIRRLPYGADEAGRDAPARMVLRRSFGAFKAAARGDGAWIEDRVEAAIALRAAETPKLQVATWQERLAASVGLPQSILDELGTALVDVHLTDQRDIAYWVEWMLAWLSSDPKRLVAMIRPSGLDTLLGSHAHALSSDHERAVQVLPNLKSALQAWMQGGTLANIESLLGTPMARLGICKKARQFVLRIVPDLAFAFGMPFQVLRAKAGMEAENLLPGMGLVALGACVREGYDSVDKLALRQVLKGGMSRVATHAEFERIRPFVRIADSPEDLSMATERIREAHQKAGAEGK
jgi:superfamily II DNA/RNA helicase